MRTYSGSRDERGRSLGVHRSYDARGTLRLEQTFDDYAQMRPLGLAWQGALHKDILVFYFPECEVVYYAATALGHRCAFALGTFQSLVAGTRTDFEVGYLLPEMIRDLKSPKAAGNWRAFRDVDFALSRVPGLNPDGTETRVSIVRSGFWNTWMRSLPPSEIFAWTRIVSPGRNSGRSLRL